MGASVPMMRMPCDRPGVASFWVGFGKFIQMYSSSSPLFWIEPSSAQTKGDTKIIQLHNYTKIQLQKYTKNESKKTMYFSLFPSFGLSHHQHRRKRPPEKRRKTNGANNFVSSHIHGTHMSNGHCTHQ